MLQNLLDDISRNPNTEFGVLSCAIRYELVVNLIREEHLHLALAAVAGLHNAFARRTDEDGRPVPVDHRTFSFALELEADILLKLGRPTEALACAQRRCVLGAGNPKPYSISRGRELLQLAECYCALNEASGSRPSTAAVLICRRVITTATLLRDSPRPPPTDDASLKWTNTLCRILPSIGQLLDTAAHAPQVDHDQLCLHTVATIQTAFDALVNDIEQWRPNASTPYIPFHELGYY
jgi:hypothetical protein